MTALRTTAPLSNPEAARAALAELRDAPLNFDIERRAEYTAATGWKLDHYRRALPPEPPGSPLERGSWVACRRLMATYAFADPAIVRAMYDADQPLERRDLLLEGRFYGLRFLLGLRVGDVEDDTITVDGRPVRRWSWNYRTLRGHLEMGQMDYAVWKWLDDGSVEFRIHVVSRPARIPNRLIRLGFRLFGRGQQIRFARRACQRMAEALTAPSGTVGSGRSRA